LLEQNSQRRKALLQLYRGRWRWEDISPEDAEIERKKQLIAELDAQIKDKRQQSDTIIQQARMKPKNKETAQQKGYEEGFAQAAASVRDEQQRMPKGGGCCRRFKKREKRYI
jgi:flagellar biosynthesis/type III secretory pathway protein FliH